MKTQLKLITKFVLTLSLTLAVTCLTGCENGAMKDGANLAGEPEYEADPWPEPDPMPVFLHLIMWINPVQFEDLENNLSDFRIEITNEFDQIFVLKQDAYGDFEGPVQAEPGELITIIVTPGDEIEAPKTVTVTFDETDEEIPVFCSPNCFFEFIVPQAASELNISIDLLD